MYNILLIQAKAEGRAWAGEHAGTMLTGYFNDHGKQEFPGEAQLGNTAVTRARPATTSNNRTHPPTHSRARTHETPEGSAM